MRLLKKILLDNVSVAINDCFMQNGCSSGFFLCNSIFLTVEQSFQTFQIAFLYRFVDAFYFLLKIHQVFQKQNQISSWSFPKIFMKHISIHVFTVILFQNSNKVVSSSNVSSLHLTAFLLYFQSLHRQLIVFSNIIKSQCS